MKSDICDILALQRDGTQIESCRQEVIPERRAFLLNRFNHIKSRARNERLERVNALESRLFPDEGFQAALFSELLQQSAGVCAWQCCPVSTDAQLFGKPKPDTQKALARSNKYATSMAEEWRVDVKDVLDTFVQVSDNMYKHARKLFGFDFADVRKEIQIAARDRQQVSCGKRGVSRSGTVVPHDLKTAYTALTRSERLAASQDASQTLPREGSHNDPIVVSPDNSSTCSVSIAAHYETRVNLEPHEDTHASALPSPQAPSNPSANQGNRHPFTSNASFVLKESCIGHGEERANLDPRWDTPSSALPSPHVPGRSPAYQGRREFPSTPAIFALETSRPARDEEEANLDPRRDTPSSALPSPHVPGHTPAHQGGREFPFTPARTALETSRPVCDEEEANRDTRQDTLQSALASLRVPGHPPAHQRRRFPASSVRTAAERSRPTRDVEDGDLDRRQDTPQQAPSTLPSLDQQGDKERQSPGASSAVAARLADDDAVTRSTPEHALLSSRSRPWKRKRLDSSGDDLSVSSPARLDILKLLARIATFAADDVVIIDPSSQHRPLRRLYRLVILPVTVKAHWMLGVIDVDGRAMLLKPESSIPSDDAEHYIQSYYDGLSKAESDVFEVFPSSPLCIRKPDESGVLTLIMLCCTITGVHIDPTASDVDFWTSLLSPLEQPHGEWALAQRMVELCLKLDIGDWPEKLSSETLKSKWSCAVRNAVRRCNNIFRSASCAEMVFNRLLSVATDENKETLRGALDFATWSKRESEKEVKSWRSLAMTWTTV